ncbi:NADH-quinone oxidoreductase [Burkholderia sp. SFA1]|uniref:NADH-quinone oxidoreductase subunit NuoG n=1 Tax=unclassified Caballeronia TaxID=2646786 RepID=UPI0002388886|nr:MULTISPECIES: NADH-quinone oxidoreductase subunit NuoG [unclassified Caballeronia]AET89533.1 NADH-quinone oxidoreductase, chain G [Burkholderia sp. YI23]MCE4541417.1 NADH-quinone oxidoreductase subunit NuoG [Caballeronia sp. PC1]MCE4569539.1 NADH-quinone oxidoreductase subunit NuoG [Caballeronia sp. CLC5]BBP96692.1 NADH-quinone oxidoreductase [Burkholderia sp. SFA1]
MVELEIDGKTVEVPEGSMVIQAAHKVDTYIPHFCYHKKLSIAANCRMCLVEVEKMPKAVPACATPVSAGMIVRTTSDKAVKAQQSVMEFLLINHPLDCPICDQGGECQLQDLAVGYGKSQSRYSEEKRVVFHKNVGPLISMEEMSRCIHCTRCVRFGQEVAGVMELGMLGRGEHSEITSFVGKTVDSELSGNMIDLCPVGALTSKPFRYSARTWELSRRKSVSPHDSVGANLVVQVKNNRVMRVLPMENEAINECWISDKDRFSYEGLNGDERLTTPMLKQGGNWIETDWQTALEYVAKGLKGIKADHGANAIAALATPHSTVEELHLLKQLAEGVGTPNVDFRLRQNDFSAPVGVGAPWLGSKIADLSLVDTAFVIGSFLRRDHPLFAARLRQAAKSGAKITFLNASNDDSLIPTAHRLVAAPSAWLDQLAGIAAAVSEARGVALPDAFAGREVSAAAKDVAASLSAGEKRVVLLGNLAVQHPDFAQIQAAAQWIADNTGATLGFLTEGANSVGAHLVDALPGEGGLNAREAFEQPRKGYVLLNAEPEYDTANPAQAIAALKAAEMVVVMSPFKHGMDYADVLLPIAPFTETSGTFVNAEGTAQSFNGVVRALGDTRPGWKVLRVLGTILGLSGFDYDTAEEVRIAALGTGDLSARLSNKTSVQAKRAASNVVLNGSGLQRLADVPIYHADALVRRAPSLHLTAAARDANVAGLPTALYDKLGLKDGEAVRIKQGNLSVTLPAVRDANLAESVVRVSAGTTAGAALGGLFGELVVEKA